MNVENYLYDVLDVTQEDLDHARSQAHKRGTSVEHELHARGLINHSEYSELLAHTQGISFISLSAKHVSPEHFTTLAEPVSRNLRVVVFDTKDGTPQIAAETLNDNIREQIKEHLEEFDLFLTDEQSISRVLGLYQTYLREHYGERIANHARKLQAFESYEYEGDVLPTRYISELQDSFDAIKITELLFSVMQTMQASDIYIDRGINNTEISMRFGARILPTINLDVHIFDRLLWVYAKSSDVDLATMEGPLNTVYLPTPQHSNLHARITFVTTNAVVSHIHINAEDTAQLFPTIEALFPSQRQAQAFLHQLNTGSLLIASRSDYERKRLYYACLEKLSRTSKRVTSLEQHVEVNIPEVMQISVNSKDKINKVITSAEILQANVVGFSQQLTDQDSYRHVTARLDYKHIFNFETIRNAVKVLNAFPYSSPVGLAVQHQFMLGGEAHMRPLSQEHKALFEKELSKIVHTIDMSGEFAHKKESKKKLKEPSRSVSVQGFVTIPPTTSQLLFDDVQRSTKAAILEHALMRSSQGEIFIEDIAQFITSS